MVRVLQKHTGSQGSQGLRGLQDSQGSLGLHGTLSSILTPTRLIICPGLPEQFWFTRTVPVYRKVPVPRPCPAGWSKCPGYVVFLEITR